MRRSSRLQQDPEPTLTPPSSPCTENEEVLSVQIDDLPDMGPRVEIYDLPDTNIGFDENYLPSQEQTYAYYSSQEEFVEEANSDSDNEYGGGLENILWPPEVMMQAMNYGRRGEKRRNAVAAERLLDNVDGAAVKVSEVGPAREPALFACGADGTSAISPCHRRFWRGAELSTDWEGGEPHGPRIWRGGESPYGSWRGGLGEGEAESSAPGLHSERGNVSVRRAIIGGSAAMHLRWVGATEMG